MPENPETPIESFSEPLKPWQKFIYMALIAIAAFSAVAAGLMIIFEIWESANLSKLIEAAYILILTSMGGFFFAAVLFAAVVQFARDDVRRRHRRGAWRHVGYQIAVFIILALSLRAFALHDEEASPIPLPNQSAKVDTKGAAAQGRVTKVQAAARRVTLTASELAAIMILFALAELAALLGKDVAYATDEIDEVRNDVKEARRSMEQTRATLVNSNTQMEISAAGIQSASEAVSKAIATLEGMAIPLALEQMHTDVKVAILPLLKAWRKRASHDVTDGADPLVHLAWRVFLESYADEERNDFAPNNLKTEGVPISAQPYETIHRAGGEVYQVMGESVAYVATNIGFYATFLGNLVNKMSSAADAGQSISLAVLTTVLPAYWWNWPGSTGLEKAYTPIERLRTTMEDMSESVRSDRLILVRGDAAPAGPRQAALSDATLLKRMEGWHVAKALQGRDLIECSRQPDESVVAVMAKMPEELQKSLKDEPGAIYPLFEQLPDQPLTMDGRDWTVAPLVDKFMELHKGGGGCWVLPIDDDFLVNKDKLDGRYDFTFIGIKDKEKGEEGKYGAWTDEAVQWKFCVMTSASDKNESMFMTLIEGQAAEMQMLECRKRLKQAFKGATPLRKPPQAPAATP